MTLTGLRYIVALARERHFGRAAEACFVSQPTLSVAVKKLEDELGVLLFERGKTEVAVTPLGERVVEQARRMLEELHRVRPCRWSRPRGSARHRPRPAPRSASSAIPR
jgi:LysR family hydrogen peroxide-inducible transcriptional activator